ncbi:biopolymer transporter ExbD [Acidobacteria bacterium AB60]|nr:biopolymer transporter ExbD [Acidobacteria bacterium AB60]
MTVHQAGLSTPQAEMNVAPLIDVLLVLLIIFMVIIPVSSAGEPTAMARQATQHSPAPMDAVVLEIVRDGAGGALFTINRQPATRAELPARLADLYARRAQGVLFIKGDDQLSFSQIAEVIDVSHAAGVDRVCLMTPRAARL